MKIKGQFPDLQSAREAVRKLQSEGINNVYVDVSNRNTLNESANVDLPGSSFVENLTNLVSNADENSAHPQITSMSNTNPAARNAENISSSQSRSYSVVIEADDNNLNNIQSIIENSGGVLENSNDNKMY